MTLRYGWHPNDPATYEPLDSEIDEDAEDMSDAEREAEAYADMLGNYPEWKP